MQHVEAWSSPDHRVLLSFSAEVMDVFRRFIQMDGPEAGGILLGTVHGRNMLVENATLPTPQDKRTRYGFERLAHGHQQLALERWNSTQGLVRYLGEWHTHPEAHPTPSSLDRSEWKRGARSRKDLRPALCVIIGQQTLFVGLSHADGTLTVMEPVS